MSRIALIRVFIEILDQFLEFLDNEFPYFKSDIMLTKSSLELMKRSNPRMIVEQFMQYVEPYSQKIFNCDEGFFLNFEQNIDQQLSQDNILFGSKLRNMWTQPETTDKQKGMVFLYFQKLIVAGRRCV